MKTNLENIMQEKASPEKVVVFMGDSITEGQYIDSPWKWFDLVRRELGPKGYYCINQGISGETSLQGLCRYATSVQRFQPDTVFIQFGLNDCNCWVTDKGLPRVSKECFAQNLSEMVSRSKFLGTKKIVLCTNPCTLRNEKMLNGKSLEEANAEYSEVIRSVAQKLQILLCDVRSAFESLEHAELATMLLPAPDLLHLSIRGHRLYADTIIDFMRCKVESED